MKAFVAGLVLIAISGGALIWHLVTRGPSAPVAERGPERTARCMVWKAERGKAVVWLCGSFHLLREEDYPLPGPYLNAFAESKVLVTESPHDPAGAAQRQARALQIGQWPAGVNLEQHLSAPAWSKLKEASAGIDLNIATLQPMKAWQAAFHMVNRSMQSLGFRPARGLESYFTAQAGSRTLASLESLDDQLTRLDSLDAATQEAMILRVCDELKVAASRAADLIEAWREGDTRRLASLSAETMDQIPAVRRVLMDERHAAWLPQLEKYLDGTDTVMILVGSAHLCGRGSLIELLEAKGVKLTQMEYRTTRPAASSGP